MELSATIIALNEEEFLSRCLESLVKVVDEIIIVIDSRSTDRTEKIASSFKCKIFKRDFDNFANQKNFALEKTSGKWVFSIDADEVVSNELAAEIKDKIKEDIYSAFLIPRRNFILGAEIKHSRWSPDKHIWLWQKDKGHWEGEVHEEVVVNGKVGELQNAKIHYQDDTIKKFIDTNNRYSSIQAKRLLDNGVSFSFIKTLWNASFEFMVRFIYKKGFLDGWRGFVLACLMAYYQLQVGFKLYKLQQVK